MEPTLNWRDTARYPRLFCIDARCALPLLLWMFHISTLTSIVAFSGVILFSTCEYFGITPDVGLRMARVSCIGSFRPVSHRYMYRRNARW
jgi:intracellular multiplication protein IcmT